MHRTPPLTPRTIAGAALRSLHAELLLYPKPGLVSTVDNGSHADMDAGMFMRSLFALRGYFVDIAAAGRKGAAFGVLMQLGLAAEARMLRATGGVNTHRGAIFCLGMLCAAAARASADDWLPHPYAHPGSYLDPNLDPYSDPYPDPNSDQHQTPHPHPDPHPYARPTLAPHAIRGALRHTWGAALAQHGLQRPPSAHGTGVALVHGIGGARAEAAAGLPAVFEHALPALRRTLGAGRGMYCARIDAFFTLLASVDDSNLYHRGGADGAAMVRHLGQGFLGEGGTGADGWRARAIAIHRTLVAHRLSPGGAADLLAATLLVHALTTTAPARDTEGRAPACDVDRHAAAETLKPHKPARFTADVA